ncbi:MAG: hypothetical protein JO040_10345 [Gemmatimonadetes bacterium]|nr:hypothetical protein [Gemmatimonadota bacterium]
MQTSLADQMISLKQDAFLRRIAEVTQGDPHRWVPIGILGEQLGLPYEEALAITDHLREAGHVRRGGGGPLDAPYGPRVHVLPEGMAYLHELDECSAA